MIEAPDSNLWGLNQRWQKFRYNFLILVLSLITLFIIAGLLNGLYGLLILLIGMPLLIFVARTLVLQNEERIFPNGDEYYILDE